MEHSIRAPFRGEIKEILCKVGAQVSENQKLFEILKKYVSNNYGNFKTN